MYEFLLGRFEHGKLQYGALKAAANEFGVNSRTINRVWTHGRESLAGGNVYADVPSRMPGKKGRTKVVVNMEKFKAIDRRKQKNIRSAVSAIGVSKSTFHRRIIEGIIKRHTNALKPYLTDANKASRLAYAIEQINESTLTGDNPHFFSQWDCVYIDEKWFYLTKECGTFYLVSDEEDPHRTGKNKRFILKVMVLAVVALARFDHVKSQWFTGKIGIFPLVYNAAAKRSSRNRPAGTMETKPIESVNKDVTKRFLIEHVFPAIRASWPRRPTRNTESSPIKIFVQQDNAKPHPKPDDPDLIREGDNDGFHIRLVCQPPNNPDMNVLDLGFFRAIQSLQHQQAPNNIDELVKAVVDSFNAMGHDKLKNVFLSLQQCLIEVMKCDGGNNYKLPHMGKEKLARQGFLPDNIACPLALYNSACK